MWQNLLSIGMGRLERFLTSCIICLGLIGTALPSLPLSMCAVSNTGLPCRKAGWSTAPPLQRHPRTSREFGHPCPVLDTPQNKGGGATLGAKTRRSRLGKPYGQRVDRGQKTKNTRHWDTNEAARTVAWMQIAARFVGARGG